MLSLDLINGLIWLTCEVRFWLIAFIVFNRTLQWCKDWGNDAVNYYDLFLMKKKQLLLLVWLPFIYFDHPLSQKMSKSMWIKNCTIWRANIVVECKACSALAGHHLNNWDKFRPFFLSFFLTIKPALDQMHIKSKSLKIAQFVFLISWIWMNIITQRNSP